MLATALGPQRPPYVEFETRAVEDRDATIKAGCYVAQDVDYAIIRAIGAKDAVEKPALDWLAHIEKQSRQRMYNPEWVKFFKEKFAEWKAGHQGEKVNGTHVKHWSAISPGQCATLIAARLLTVEDVAFANEEALQRIGMGARGLKQRAQAWLDSKNGAAEELALLRQDNQNMKDKLGEYEKKFEQLTARLSQLEGDGEQKPSRKRA